MTARKPLWTQAGTTSAEEDRAAIRALLQSGGVLVTTDLAVTQNGTPNMSVNVAAGRVAIPGTESASLQGTYLGWLDATQNTVIAASDATNPRIDLIVAKVLDAQYSGASNTFSVVAVTGTPAASPVAPTAPANSIILAQIAVAATVTTIVTANITDKRIPAGARLPILTSTSLYPTAAAGIGAYRMTNDTAEGPEFCTFAGSFRKAWNMPWGIAPNGYAAITANQAGITAEADVTGLTLTNTWVANRRIRVTVQFRSTKTTDGQVSVLVNSAGTSHSVAVLNIVDTRSWIGSASWVYATTAGSVTDKITMIGNATAGSVSAIATATNPFFMTVEDIGPSGAPA